jgi:hypothetical protein
MPSIATAAAADEMPEAMLAGAALMATVDKQKAAI